MVHFLYSDQELINLAKTNTDDIYKSIIISRYLSQLEAVDDKDIDRLLNAEIINNLPYKINHFCKVTALKRFNQEFKYLCLTLKDKIVAMDAIRWYLAVSDGYYVQLVDTFQGVVVKSIAVLKDHCFCFRTFAGLFALYCDKILSIYKISNGEFSLDKQVTLNIETKTIKLITEDLVQFDEGVISLISGRISHTKLAKTEPKVSHDCEFGVSYYLEGANLMVKTSRADYNLMVKALTNDSKLIDLIKVKTFKNLPIVLQSAYCKNF